MNSKKANAYCQICEGYEWFEDGQCKNCANRKRKQLYFVVSVLVLLVLLFLAVLSVTPVGKPDLYCGGHPPCADGWNGMLPDSARVQTENPYLVGDVICVVSGSARESIPSKTTVLGVYEDLLYVDGHMGPINHLHYEKCDD